LFRVFQLHLYLRHHLPHKEDYLELLKILQYFLVVEKLVEYFLLHQHHRENCLHHQNLLYHQKFLLQ
jgi:hypothetical protein